MYPNTQRPSMPSDRASSGSGGPGANASGSMPFGTSSIFSAGDAPPNELVAHRRAERRDPVRAAAMTRASAANRRRVASAPSAAFGDPLVRRPAGLEEAAHLVHERAAGVRLERHRDEGVVVAVVDPSARGRSPGAQCA